MRQLLLLWKYFLFVCEILYIKIWYHDDDFYERSFLRIAQQNIILIKLLQCSSSNYELWSDNNRQLLAKYIDNVPYSYLDVDYEMIFYLRSKGVLLEDEPIHAGSIALVYKGVYESNQVAVKIKRKNIDALLVQHAEEFEFIMWVLSYIPFICRMDFDVTYQIYKPLLEAQCDFTNEIYQLNKYKSNFEYNKQVVFPEVYLPVCSDKVIVMDFMEGITMNQIKEEDKEQYMNIIGDVMVMSIIIHGFFHCDGHAGNIIFQKNECTRELSIAIIDFGICGYLTVPEINQFYELFTAIGNSDYHLAEQLFLKEFSDYDKILKPIPENDLIQMRDIFEDAFDVHKHFSFHEMYRIYAIASKHNIKLTLSWIKIELAIASIDGCFNALCYNDIGLTDIIKQKIRTLNELNEFII